MKVKIKDTEFEVKYTLRAMMMWEAITGKRFEIVTITDQWVFYYALLLASNPETNITFEDFIEACDDDPGIFIQFSEFINVESKKRNIFKTDDDGSDAEKKSGQ